MSENEKVICSFCGKNKQDTNVLIAGTSAHICDACIEQAHGIVKEDIISETTLSKDFKLLKPKYKFVFYFFNFPVFLISDLILVADIF